MFDKAIQAMECTLQNMMPAAAAAPLVQPLGSPSKHVQAGRARRLCKKVSSTGIPASCLTMSMQALPTQSLPHASAGSVGAASLQRKRPGFIPCCSAAACDRTTRI